MTFEDMLHSAARDCTWSMLARDVDTGDVLLSHEPDRVLKAASIGKLVLLGAVAALADDGVLDLDESVSCAGAPEVRDSGVLQHLSVPELSVADLCSLVFACSDNTATNVLIDHLGLDRIRALRPRLGFRVTDLFDHVRDVRTPEHAPTLSVASAAELVDVMAAVWHGTFVSASASAWLLNGLRLNTDLSMVPATLCLDPLSHTTPDPAASVANKTGTDVDVRADTGLITVNGRTAAYAAICNLDPDHVDPDQVGPADVVRDMNRIGEHLRATLAA
jgi:beta-lactamase class A